MRPDDSKGWSLLGRTDYYWAARTSVAELLKRKHWATRAARCTPCWVATTRTEGLDQGARLLPARGADTRDMLLIGQMYVFQGIWNGGLDLSRHHRPGLDRRDASSPWASWASCDSARRTIRRPDLLQRRIALDPNNGEAYYYIGLSYKEMKQYSRHWRAPSGRDHRHREG